ncbi:MAG: FtsX-like permease family protein [Candidatus Heimdallarchaeota archaeon]|nr:MAG: FtsX-like permease family protein [Candidatus Heimdallarchaeota archaeon]
MKILTKKIFREIRFNKFRSSMIILAVFLALTLGLGLINLKDSAMESVAETNRQFNNADLRIRLTEYVPENEISSLLSESERETAGITELEGRIFEYSTVIHNNKIHKAYLIGVDFKKTEINKLKLRTGSDKLSNDQVLVEQHFGNILPLGARAKLNDDLSILFRNSMVNVSIAGFVADSEYIFVVDEQTNVITLGDLCIIYMPLEMLHEKFNLTGINEILVKTQERSNHANQKADQALSPVLGENKIQNVIYWDESMERGWLELRTDAMEKIGFVFGLFALIVGSLAIYNSLSKLIMAQRSHIGLYGALGAKNQTILNHYTGFGLILGLIGIILGWIGAALTTFLLVNIGINVFGLTVIVISSNPINWIGITLLALILVLIFSILATLPILQLTPHEALRAPYSTSELGREPLLERIFLKFRIFRRLVSKIPLRSVFMNKRRSFSTAIVVAASMVILVVSSSLFYDYVYALDQNYTFYEKYDVKVLLVKPEAEKDIKKWVQQNIPEISDVEGFVYTSVWIGNRRIPLQAFHQNSSLRDYNVISGTKVINKDKILLGNNLATELEKKSGDEISLSFDLRSNISVEIAGVTGEIAENTILWTIEGIQNHFTDVQQIGLMENVTAFVFDFEESISKASKTEVKKLIQERFGSYAYIDSNEAKQTIMELLSIFLQILMLVALLGLATLVLFTFSSMSLAMMEREMEFLALRAMGSERRTILKLIFIENLIYGIIGFFIGVPLSIVLLKPTYEFILPDLYLPAVVPIELWVFLFVIIGLCVLLSTSLIAWRTWRSSLPDMLYSRMVY